MDPAPRRESDEKSNQMAQSPDIRTLERLVAQAQQGSEDAWRQLVEAHYRLAYLTTPVSYMSNISEDPFGNRWVRDSYLAPSGSDPK